MSEFNSKFEKILGTSKNADGSTYRDRKNMAAEAKKVAALAGISGKYNRDVGRDAVDIDANSELGTGSVTSEIP